MTTTTARDSVRRLLSGEGEAEVKVKRNRTFKQNSNSGNSFGRQFSPRFSLVFLKFVPNNQRTVLVPFGSRLLTFREWTCVRSSVEMRSPSWCAAFLASSPGHPFKVFAIIQADLQYLTLTEARSQRHVIRCIKFYCLIAFKVKVKRVFTLKTFRKSRILTLTLTFTS